MSVTGAPLAPVAFLACGALALETAEIVRRRGWHADVHGVSAFLHLSPLDIAPAVDAKLADLTGRYGRVIVVYGDCGTGGRIDRVIERYPAARPAGVHCYQWFAGGDFARIAEERPGTYFLTDWLVRSWDTAVVRGLGLDRWPWLKETYFGSMTHVLYLRQDPDPALERKASEIAAYLGLPIEIRETGLEPLEALLEPLMEETDVHA
ncbi:MAG TPA: DUF1638 domain-containing protein [Actinomycetota bacterium]|nr:DUF1638 domain-containing protein [Actinomycetota bacterium]